MRRSRSLGLAAAAGIVAASCSSSDGSDAAPETVETAVTDTEAAGSTTDEADEADASTTETADTEPPASAPEATDPPTTAASTSDADENDDGDVDDAYDFSAIDPIVSTFVAERGLNGAGLIVVDDDDGIVHEEYWGEFGPDRVSFIASSSKMITAGVLMHLADDGFLDMDAPVATVTEWGAGNPDITPAQLVSNSAGLVGLIDGIAIGGYACQYGTAGTLQQCAESIFTTPDDDAEVVAPDTEFRYGGAQWQVAGAVAEVVSGKSWAELIDEIYVETCGVDSLAYNNHFGVSGLSYPTQFASDPSAQAPTENPNMEGGAYITAPDYAELLLMHLRDGECEGGRVLSEDSVDRMHADRIAEAYGGSAGDDTGYGMGWWVDRPTGRISDGGAYGSVPWLDLDEGYGAYLVIEADSGTGNDLAAFLYEPVAAAIDGD